MRYSKDSLGIHVGYQIIISHDSFCVFHCTNNYKVFTVH